MFNFYNLCTVIGGKYCQKIATEFGGNQDSDGHPFQRVGFRLRSGSVVLMPAVILKNQWHTEPTKFNVSKPALAISIFANNGNSSAKHTKILNQC